MLQGYHIIHDVTLIMSIQSFFSATLAGDDVERLVTDNSGKSINDMAVFLRNHLVNTYPTQYWVVTVYSDVTGYDKHAFYFDEDRVSYKLRHHGFNYVVTRYPSHSARSPSVPIGNVVGSITGDNAKKIAESINSEFEARGLTYASIHVVKRSWTEGFWGTTYRITLTTGSYIPEGNFFFGKFSNVIVIIVAP